MAFVLMFISMLLLPKLEEFVAVPEFCKFVAEIVGLDKVAELIGGVGTRVVVRVFVMV